MASASRTAEIFLICCLEGDLNVVSRILKKNRRSWPGLMARGGGGFDINCRDASNRSGLILATISCWTQIVDLLLSRSDLDVNLTDIFGCTALMYASKSEEGEEIVRLLLERKDLDLDGKDEDGKTAEDFAADTSNAAVVALIREERARRMGGGWTKGEAEEEETENTVSSASEDDEGSSSLEEDQVTAAEAAADLEKEVKPANAMEDDILKTQLVGNLRERMEREMLIMEQREQEYNSALANLQTEKQREEHYLRQQLKTLEEKFTESKRKMDETFSAAEVKSRNLISQLEHLIDNIDVDKILNQSQTSATSELECPVCLEEMRPPTRIWQCVSGHPVCDTCIRSPRVKECPTCRQKIVGRNVLAEKLAKSLYGN